MDERYLWIIMDDRLCFKDHVRMTVDKANNVISSLPKLMSNVGGPKEQRRRLLVSVVHLVLLYNDVEIL